VGNRTTSIFIYYRQHSSMLGIRKLSVWPGDLHLSDEVRQTVSRGLGKRPYLEDCKPLMTVFTPKNITTQLLKAALIPANLVMLDYNNHVLECEKNGDDIDFDWKTCLEKHFAKFQLEAQKAVSVSVLKKFLEEFAILGLPAKIADKLSKNIDKSLVRKRTKFARLVAGQRIFQTALWSNAMQYGSLCLYDVCYRTGESLVACAKKWRAEGMRAALVTFPALELLVFSSKKLLYYALCWGSSSAGYALGSCVHEHFGGLVGSLLFEVATGLSLSMVLTL
jgi:hypothetical protein